MKTIRIFLLVLIIIGIGLLLTQNMWVPKLVDMIMQSSPEGHNTVSQNTAQVAGTPQKFIDAMSGFGFEYPWGWNAVRNNKKYSVCLTEHGSSSCAVGINIVVAPDEQHPEGVVSNEDLIRAFKSRYAKETITSRQNIVNGLHILVYSSPEETQAFIETATYDYNFIVSSINEQGNVRADFENIKKVLDSMLLTVKVQAK